METLLVANEDKVRQLVIGLSCLLCVDIPAGLCYFGLGTAHQAVDSGMCQEHGLCLLENKPQAPVFGFDVWELCLNGILQMQIKAMPVYADVC